MKIRQLVVRRIRFRSLQVRKFGLIRVAACEKLTSTCSTVNIKKDPRKNMCDISCSNDSFTSKFFMSGIQNSSLSVDQNESTYVS